MWMWSLCLSIYVCVCHQSLSLSMCSSQAQLQAKIPRYSGMHGGWLGMVGYASLPYLPSYTHFALIALNGVN